MNLSFFAKTPFLRENKEANSGLYLQRLSSIVRGEEVAKFLGAKYNPKAGFEKDVCIYIKPAGLEKVKDGDFVDVLDDWKLTETLKSRPKVKVIAMSGPHFEWLKTILKNQVVLIPHHHLNFERVKRTRTEVINCGYIGTFSPYHVKINIVIAERLKKIGLNFIQFHNFKARDDSLNFYKQIDVQIIGHFRHIKNVPHYHATKIINAMSFGIPTVTGPKLGYKDVDDYYIRANNLDELIKEVEKLKDQKYYDLWAKKIIPEAEKYHISKIAKLYKSLPAACSGVSQRDKFGSMNRNKKLK